MTVGASETAKPFSEATCQALVGLVLRCGGLSAASTPPADFISSLSNLAEGDSALAVWGREVRARIRRGASSLNDMDDVEDVWGGIAAHLPELLIVGSPPGGDPTSQHDVWQQLQTLCHCVVRLRTLETRFSSELQRQKSEAIYEFAYGLSHELNNPLANIATRGGVLAQQEAHPQRKILLETIVANAMRGCEMLGDLMLVARPPKLQFQAVRIDELIATVVKQAQRWASGLNVVVAFNCNSTQALQLDAVALREALWALIRNALEAMLEGGTVEVSVSDQNDGKVCIEVADQGSGMSQAALEHCFDPYYSGREAGRGLGLGLSKAQRIVALHRGELTLANRPGGGAVARIVLRQP